MNNLMIFENKEVEVFELNGQVLFNPKDVAKCLGIVNINDNLSKMNNKQVVKLRNSDIGNADIRNLNNAGENFLTESGVYKLIFKSRKAAAERFQDWVTDEVLPEIRKTGSYEFKNISLEDLIIKQAQSVKEVKNQLNQVNYRTLRVEKEIDDLPLLSVDTVELTTLAKRRIVGLLGGKGTSAYKKFSKKAFKDIYSTLHNNFQVGKICAIKRKDLELAKKVVSEYKLPVYLSIEVERSNKQINMEF